MMKTCGPSKENTVIRKNPDLVITCYPPGSRDAALASLGQRSQNATRKREVTVPLLDHGSPAVPSTMNSVDPITNSQHAPGVQAEASTAAAAAAAVAAAARLIKTQSDMEARISRLADSVQMLLDADREVRPKGQSLCQQTLQHVEMLHSHHLQSQSELQESGLSTVTRHVPATVRICCPAVISDPPASESGFYKQQYSSSTARAATVVPTPVAMATPHCDQRPEHTRDDWHQQTAPSVSMLMHPAKGSSLQTSASHTQATVKNASEKLRKMRCLVTEMKMLLEAEDEQKTTQPPATTDSQIQQTHNQQTNSQHITSKQSEFQYTQSLSQNAHPQQSQPQQSHSVSHQPEPQSRIMQFQPHPCPYQQSETQQNHSQSQQTQPQYPQDNKIKSKHAQSKSQLSQESHSLLPKRTPVSALEKARMTLRSVQRRRKILDENLEAVERARNGALFHYQLDAMAANRDVSEEVRIKKMVDVWIKNITKEIQVERDLENTTKSKPKPAYAATKSRITALGWQHGPDGRNKETPGKDSRTVRSKVTAVRGRRELTAKHGRQAAGHRFLRESEAEKEMPAVRGRELADLDRELFLKRLYGRAPHEGQRRTLKKSPYLCFRPPASPCTKAPPPCLVQILRGVNTKSCKTQTSWAPSTSPKCKPVQSLPEHSQPHHLLRSSHGTSKDFNNLPGTDAMTCSFPVPTPLGPPVVTSSPRFLLTEHPQEVTSLPTVPPSSKMAPTEVGPTNLQKQRAEELDRGEAAPPLPTHMVKIAEVKSEEEDEDLILPGSDFIFASNADVIQEDVSNVDAELVELDGCPSPPPVAYQGPVFPPQAKSALPAEEQVPILDLTQHRDTLENQLVEWVEQQVMYRIISDMYRPLPTDPVGNGGTNQSEPEEQSVASDIDEAAGGGGPQLSGDVGMSVDSATLRQLVNEVLAEIISTMMQPKKASEKTPESKLGLSERAYHEETLVPTPVPTPPSSPCLPIRDTTQIATPSPSDTLSLLSEESCHPTPESEKVATPTSSPEPVHSPARIPTGIHPAPPPLPWEDAELPLAEERPEDNLNTHTQPIVMSVAEEEPPLSSPLSTIPPPQTQSSPPPPQSQFEASSPSAVSSTDDSSSSSVSITVTQRTDTANKHISEGELLISGDLMAATGGLLDVFCFSNTLQDMDCDDLSEGQVNGHNPQLTLQGKRVQILSPRHRHASAQPEGSWGEEGEVRKDYSPSHTRNTAKFWGQDSSPGQITEASFGNRQSGL
ncbi:protein TALPID3 [Thalassophryne amazonica]|uniref:protein TALPID3 n=1 Tax=Thalassophryne amazonica TaxID=390379 RepID=UPI001471A532|nr:protein TALPID3 [Thalassophryne amazonica]